MMKSEFVFALENAAWPAFLVDEAGTIRRVNQAAVKAFGAVLEGEFALLSAIWSPANEGTAEQFLARWERSPSATVSLKFSSKGGITTGYLTHICSATWGQQKHFVFQLLAETDAGPGLQAAALETKVLNLEASVAHKQKLDCALQLARTVALDFNNALTSILGHTSLVLSRMPPNDPWRASLMEVEKSAAKAAEIASDLGTFSRQEKDTRGQTAGNLNLLLQPNVELFQSSNKGKINWSLQLERKLFTVKFDEAKMQQAFVKILENAVQALGPANGRISIQTRNLELRQPTQDRNVHLAAGNYVCVEIADNGCGIEPEVLPRIFEPFFTTKPGGTHRGLGLAWVYGIVTNHGGGVAVSSHPGTGTSVRVYLPAEKKVVKDNGVSTADLHGTQTILMVDDEDLLLTMGQTILSAFGYRVLTANSGAKALEILSQNETHIDLIITDLVMPNMSGRDLIEHVRQLAPELRIIRSSGYVWPMGKEDDADYLQKPFTSQELLLKVKQVLTPQETT
ncbi:MAG: response regulator [Verrucomicrobia bacterium]|nr:response regulator [Verrucomicrobiota bacterium]